MWLQALSVESDVVDVVLQSTARPFSSLDDIWVKFCDDSFIGCGTRENADQWFKLAVLPKSDFGVQMGRLTLETKWYPRNIM